MGENTDDIKKANTAKTGSRSGLEEFDTIRKFFSREKPTHPVGQKTLFSAFLANMINKRDICTGKRQIRIHQCIRGLKKVQINHSINQLIFMNAAIVVKGGGEKKGFSPQQKSRYGKQGTVWYWKVFSSTTIISSPRSLKSVCRPPFLVGK